MLLHVTLPYLASLVLCVITKHAYTPAGGLQHSARCEGRQVGASVACGRSRHAGQQLRARRTRPVRRVNAEDGLAPSHIRQADLGGGGSLRRLMSRLDTVESVCCRFVFGGKEGLFMRVLLCAVLHHEQGGLARAVCERGGWPCTQPYQAGRPFRDG